MATSKLVKTNEKIAEALTEVFFNIEHSVVDTPKLKIPL